MKNLYEFFGWKGGTIHEISRETGCNVNDLLYRKPESTYTGTDYNKGTYWKTNSLVHRVNILKPMYYGNLDYWLGVRDRIDIE